MPDQTEIDAIKERERLKENAVRYHATALYEDESLCPGMTDRQRDELLAAAYRILGLQYDIDPSSADDMKERLARMLRTR